MMKKIKFIFFVSDNNSQRIYSNSKHIRLGIKYTLLYTLILFKNRTSPLIRVNMIQRSLVLIVLCVCVDTLFKITCETSMFYFYLSSQENKYLFDF